MKREVIESKELEKILTGIYHEVGFMCRLEPKFVEWIINECSLYLSDYLKNVIVVNLN